MNKKTAMHNPSDLYQAFVQEYLVEHPDCWASQSSYDPLTHRRIQSRTRNAFIFRKERNQVVEVMSYTRWLKIINTYYLMGRKKVIEGKTLQFGHCLGRLGARTISRYHGNRKIDWHNTRKQPLVDDGKGGLKRAKIVYYTSDTYSRIIWKKLGRITNESIYRFVPAKGNRAGKGFTGEFSTALKENPLLETLYEQKIMELI